MGIDTTQEQEPEAPTTELVSGVTGDRCSSCQTPLANDQRYCVNCGERRGKPRFSYSPTDAPAAAPAAVPPHRSRASGGLTLVAGVATLLLAMGVGILIGHDSNTPAPTRNAAQVITVNGGGTAGTGTTAATNATSSAASSASHKSAKVKVTTVHVTAKTAKAAAQAASKVLGGSGNLSKNVTQQVGGSCTSGAGCQGGKFTGNFFPGG